MRNETLCTEVGAGGPQHTPATGGQPGPGGPAAGPVPPAPEVDWGRCGQVSRHREPILPSNNEDELSLGNERFGASAALAPDPLYPWHHHSVWACPPCPLPISICSGTREGSSLLQEELRGHRGGRSSEKGVWTLLRPARRGLCAKGGGSQGLQSSLVPRNLRGEPRG